MKVMLNRNLYISINIVNKIKFCNFGKKLNQLYLPPTRNHPVAEFRENFVDEHDENGRNDLGEWRRELCI